MRIYLDSCCFNRPFDDQSQLRIKIETESKLEIQDRIRNGDLDLAWSYILDLENSANPFEDRKCTIREWKRIAESDIEETAEILATANDLRAKGFKTKDSLHLACAIVLGCQYFVTTDDGILRKRGLISGVEVMNPVEYITRSQE